MAPRNQSNNQNKPAPMPLSQVIRQAGTGGITKQELKTITQDSGKSSGAVVQKLDKINQNIKKNDGVGINLNSGAANMLIREASRATPAFGSIFGGPSPFGTGRIGQTLQGMIGSRASGGYINPISGQQSMTPAVERTLLPRGMDLMPSGRQTVRGIGPQYTGPEKVTIKNPVGGDGDPLGSDRVTSSTQETPIITEKEPMTPEEMAAASTDGRFDSAVFGNWAPGFRRKGSSRSKGPRNARTLGGATRVNPVGSFRGGM